MLIKSFIGVAFFVFLKCCNEQYEKINDVLVLPDTVKTMDAEITLKDTLSNYYYSRINHAASGGLRHTFLVPEKYKDRQWKAIFSGSLRTNFVHSNSYINVLGLTENDSILIYQGVPLKYFVTELNAWCFFKDSISIKSTSWHYPLKKIVVYAFLGSSPLENFDIDTLKVSYLIKNE